MNELVVRRPGYRFAPDVPRHWCHDSALWTHLLNAFTLVFPEGERYLVRVIERAAAGLDDAPLRAVVRGFVGQEAQHAVEHQRFLETLRRQGYSIDLFLRGWRATLRWLERLGQPFNLSLVAATEHLATLLGDFLLRSDLLDGCPPPLASLFAWHALEEIEHREVAHAVASARGVGYARRQLGMLVASALVGASLFGVAAVLLAQDPHRRPWRWAVDAWRLFGVRGLAVHLLGGAAAYLAPRFDPATTSSPEVAARWERWALEAG